MDYINTSHPNFMGGSKAVETALQQVKSSRISLSIARPKVVIPLPSCEVFKVIILTKMKYENHWFMASLSSQFTLFRFLSFVIRMVWMLIRHRLLKEAQSLELF